MTTLTLSTVAVMLYGVLGRRGYGLSLALGGATGAGAAFVIGSTAVPTFYAVSLGTVVALALRLLPGQRLDSRGESSGRFRLSPGVLTLLLFFSWSALVTVVAPVIFDGIPVSLPVDDATLKQLHAGVLTASNLAQMIYLALGICVVAFLARTRFAGPGLIGLAAGLTTLLSAWRYLNQNAGLPFPTGVFDNSPFFAYIETAPGGAERFRGILSEPSALAASSLVTAVYMISRATHVNGRRRFGALTVAAIAGFLGVISTSTTFVVAAVVVVAIAALTFTAGFLLRRRSLTALIGIVSCIAVVVALWVIPVVASFVEATVNAKVASASFDERSGADTASYSLLFNTFGTGVGLGANRASSFFAGLLSTTGIIGTSLFAMTVASLILRTSSVREYRPVIWALVTTIVLKAVAGPDLSDSSGILWMSLGLLSRAALIAERPVDASTERVATPAPSPTNRLWSLRGRRMP